MEPKFHGRWSILLTFENYRIGVEARFLTARGRRHQPACSSPSFFSAHGQNRIGSRASAGRMEPEAAPRVHLGQETAMNSNNQARLRVAALIYLIVNAVVFGVCLITVLMTPTLAQHAFFWIPAIIVTSFVLSAPLAWFIAPSMMIRFILTRRVH
jgi:positive regulator of sigma E activity